jgi:hypothetical protein
MNAKEIDQEISKRDNPQHESKSTKIKPTSIH